MYIEYDIITLITPMYFSIFFINIFNHFMYTYMQTIFSSSNSIDDDDIYFEEDIEN